MRRALGYSFSIHLSLAALLAAVQMGGAPAVSPPVIMVDWIENSSLGSDAVMASPNLRPSPKKIAAVKPISSPAENGLSKSAAEAIPASSQYSQELQARRMTLEESYVASVRQTLERHKVYPPLAKRLGQTGQLTLKFEVGKTGELLRSEIADLSPYPVLNEAAKNLIVAVRFPPIPEELQRPSWSFTYLVKYDLD